jgi:hypothetical protein
MENETREVTYLSVSLIIMALVLSFIMYGLSTIHLMSGTRNDEVAANDKLEQYREFNAYDKKTILGDDVIELIRQQYDSGIDIFVDKRSNASTSQTVNATSNGIATDSTPNCRCIYCKNKGGDHRIFNLSNYLIHKNLSSEYNYFSIEANATNATRDDMRNWFPPDSKYRAYLVYNGDDVKTYYNALIANFNIEKNHGYGVGEDGYIRALDSGVREIDPSAVVTGIILINYTTLGL